MSYFQEKPSGIDRKEESGDELMESQRSNEAQEPTKDGWKKAQSCYKSRGFAWPDYRDSWPCMCPCSCRWPGCVSKHGHALVATHNLIFYQSFFKDPYSFF